MNIQGGNKFSAALQAMATAVTSADTVKIGILSGATYPNGTPVAMVAAIQEFGAPRAGIPPRPFFRNMIAAHQAEWGPATGELLKANDYDAAKTLAQVGEAIAGQLRQSIVDTNSPALSPVTLMLRKMQGEGITITGKQVGVARARVASGESTSGVSTKPLVWTGHLLNSIDYEVNSK